MPTPLQPISPEETMAAIIERANVLKQQGQPPMFDVNVSRRNSAGVPQQLLSFSNATVEHIANHLRWLPQLVGGGEYILNVRHPDLPDRIGGPLPASYDKTMPGMEPKVIDPRIARGPNWVGPTLVGGAYTEPQNGQPHAGATVLPWGASAPSQVTSGYGFPTTPVAPVADAAVRERELAQQLADLKAQNARIEAESRARAELENERRISDQRVRDAEAKADRAVRESEERMRQQIAALAAQQPKTDPAAGWKDLIGLVMPLVTQMLTSQQEMRILMMKTADENTRRQIEASKEQHQAQMEMIRAITAKPPGMSEELRLLIETLKADKGNNSSDAMAAFMTRQIEAMGMMSKMSIDLVNTAADLSMGDSEHPAVGAIREAALALKTMMAGVKEGAQRSIPQKRVAPGQPQLTPQQQAQVLAAQARQRAAQQQAAQAAGRVAPQKPAASVAPATAPGPAPVPVIKYEQPTAAAQPQPAPAPPEPTAPPQPELMRTPDGRYVTHFDILKAGIAELKTVDEVVSYFVQLKNADELSLKQKLDAIGGSPWELLKTEFGMKFVTSNMDYFGELGEAIDAAGVEQGWWPASEDDGEGESEPEIEAAEAAQAVAVIPLDAEPVEVVPAAAAIVVAPAPK